MTTTRVVSIASFLGNPTPSRRPSSVVGNADEPRSGVPLLPSVVTMPNVHRVARSGFGNAAQTYTRGRPEYPPELLAWLRRTLALGPGKTAVDLGAGTGKFTKLLIQTAATVIAVEPVDAMRTEFAAALPEVRAITGTAQAMTLPDAISGAVLCAQAFHWFAFDEALAEIHRVLKPGGKLGLVWNVRDESVDWFAAITNIIAPYEGDTPRYYKNEWRRPFKGALFSELRETHFPYQHIGSPQQVIVDRFLSVSFIAALPELAKSKVAQQLSELIASHPDLKDRSTIAFPYQTHAYCCDRV
jgi:ubiquinone/menaquinone biosynthesis C-methylase UbiE